MTVTRMLDPTNERSPPLRPRRRPAAPLAASRVGLLDISKPRGDVFLDRLAELLGERGVAVTRHAKPTYAKPAPAETVTRLADQCDVVVEALAD